MQLAQSPSAAGSGAMCNPHNSLPLPPPPSPSHSLPPPPSPSLPSTADVKMDWCNTDINGTQLDPKVQYPQMVSCTQNTTGGWGCGYPTPPTLSLLPQSKALNSTGKPIFFNSCEGGKENPWEWMAQYANSWRSGRDHHDSWSSTSSIIEHNAELGKYAAPGGWNDWDFLMTGGQVREGPGGG